VTIRAAALGFCRAGFPRGPTRRVFLLTLVVHRIRYLLSVFVFRMLFVRERRADACYSIIVSSGSIRDKRNRGALAQRPNREEAHDADLSPESRIPIPRLPIQRCSTRTTEPVNFRRAGTFSPKGNVMSSFIPGV